MRKSKKTKCIRPRGEVEAPADEKRQQIFQVVALCPKHACCIWVINFQGVVTKSRDPTHGKKFVYRLTEKGLDLVPVMFAIMDWSEKYDEQTEVPRKFIHELRNRPKSLRREILAGLVRP